MIDSTRKMNLMELVEVQQNYFHSGSTLPVRKRPHPLAVYVFSNRKSEHAQASDQLQFGGMTINDTMQHVSNPYLPFGGVGASGMGSYHGKWGFEAFSHQKSIQKKATWIDVPLKYPPFTEWKDKVIRKFLK